MCGSLFKVKLIEFFRQYHSLFGCRGVWLAADARFQKRSTQVSVAVPGLRHPVWLRLRTSDMSTFRQVLMSSGYDYQLAHPPETIVDAGAHIGLASVYYANKYPDATIVSIEPERSNFEMLAKNVAAYPNVIPIQRALWKNTERLSLTNPGAGNWSFQTEVAASSEATLQPCGTALGITLDMVMQQYGFKKIDLLKMDIEGAEKEVFANAANWIDRVDAIAVELHEYLNPGCEAAFDAATAGFARCVRGETVFAERTTESGSKSFRSNGNSPSEWLHRNDPPTRCRIVQAIRS
jgi:FkbM family methyltransferase